MRFFWCDCVYVCVCVCRILSNVMSNFPNTLEEVTLKAESAGISVRSYVDEHNSKCDEVDGRLVCSLQLVKQE